MRPQRIVNFATPLNTVLSLTSPTVIRNQSCRPVSLDELILESDQGLSSNFASLLIHSLRLPTSQFNRVSKGKSILNVKQ